MGSNRVLRYDITKSMVFLQTPKVLDVRRENSSFRLVEVTSLCSELAQFTGMMIGFARDEIVFPLLHFLNQCIFSLD